MVNSVISKTKVQKLKDVFIFTTNSEKNLFRSTFFFNYVKFRKKKWKYYRSKNQFDMNFIFTRYAPNITYVPKYTHLVTEPIDVDNMKINKMIQLLSYRSKLFLIRRLLGFFLIRKTKLLKKFMVFKQMNIHFNVFDTNFEVLLTRLCIAKTIKEARIYIQKGILKINNHIVTQTRHLNHLDLVKFSTNCINFIFTSSQFNFKIKKYELIKDCMNLKIIDFLRVLIIDEEPNKFIGFLPFTSTFNFSTFSFIYFNILMKNQWHIFIDFYVAKKFLHYAR
jgi:hypothetical protein